MRKQRLLVLIFELYNCFLWSRELCDHFQHAYFIYHDSFTQAIVFVMSLCLCISCKHGNISLLIFMQNILSIHKSSYFSELPLSPVAGLSALFIGNAVLFITSYAGSSSYKKPLIFPMWVPFIYLYIYYIDSYYISYYYIIIYS